MGKKLLTNLNILLLLGLTFREVQKIKIYMGFKKAPSKMVLPSIHPFGSCTFQRNSCGWYHQFRRLRRYFHSTHIHIVVVVDSLRMQQISISFRTSCCIELNISNINIIPEYLMKSIIVDEILYIQTFIYTKFSAAITFM